MLFLINKGLISRITDCNLSVAIAKYAYSIFIMHLLVFQTLKGTLWKYHSDFVHAYPILNIFIPLTLAIAAGVWTYHFIEVPAARYLKNKWFAKNYGY
jgi:peptidoglycan/LPS O-acetylase OafA/YrhL